MSDNENGGGKAKGWTDRERLVYLFALMEKSSVGKLDYKSTPRPQGRSEIACERMVGRLKTTLKDDLEKLYAGQEIADPDAAPKTPKTPKRKSKTNDEEGSPKKRGRKKKGSEDGQDANGEGSASKEADNGYI